MEARVVSRVIVLSGLRIDRALSIVMVFARNGMVVVGGEGKAKSKGCNKQDEHRKR